MILFSCMLRRCRLVAHLRVHSAFRKKCVPTLQPYSCTTCVPPLNILFFGTDEFSTGSLRALCNEMKSSKVVGHLEVVSSTKSHKPNPVVKMAAIENLKVHPWPLQSVPPKFHVGLVASFGHLIPKKIIDGFPLGMLNVHASLLPRWRGAAPIVYAVLNGDTETGVSIMQIRPHRFDVGPVLKQVHCPIGPHDTAADVQVRLAHHGATALLEVVRCLPQSLEWAVPQLESGATYAPKVTPALHCVNWHSMTATDVYNLCRALGHATCQWHNTAIRLAQPDPERSVEIPLPQASAVQTATDLHRSAVLSANHPKAQPHETFPKECAPPGTVRFHRRSAKLRVMCADSKWVAFARVVVTGKKPMSAIDFYNGFLSKRTMDDWILK